MDSEHHEAEHRPPLVRLSGLFWEKDRFGRQYSAPGGMHDDFVVATALAWYGGHRRGVYFARLDTPADREKQTADQQTRAASAANWFALGNDPPRRGMLNSRRM